LLTVIAKRLVTGSLKDFEMRWLMHSGSCWHWQMRLVKGRHLDFEMQREKYLHLVTERHWGFDLQMVTEMRSRMPMDWYLQKHWHLVTVRQTVIEKHLG
jgi:hypothetical protein